VGLLLNFLFCLFLIRVHIAFILTAFLYIVTTDRACPVQIKYGIILFNNVILLGIIQKSLNVEINFGSTDILSFNTSFAMFISCGYLLNMF
jgi:hypothetical protein